MTKRTIALDVDGVLGNFYLHLCRRYNKPYKLINVWLLDWIREVFHEVESDPEFWETIPLITPPELLTLALEEANLELVAFISSFPKEMQASREKWLKDNGFPDVPLYWAHSADKWEVCQKLNVDFFVDDKPSTVKMFLDKGTTQIFQFVPEYMDESAAVTSRILYNFYNLNNLT